MLVGLKVWTRGDSRAFSVHGVRLSLWAEEGNR